MSTTSAKRNNFFYHDERQRSSIGESEYQMSNVKPRMEIIALQIVKTRFPSILISFWHAANNINEKFDAR